MSKLNIKSKMSRLKSQMEQIIHSICRNALNMFDEAISQKVDGEIGFLLNELYEHWQLHYLYCIINCDNSNIFPGIHKMNEDMEYIEKLNNLYNHNESYKLFKSLRGKYIQFLLDLQNKDPSYFKKLIYLI